MSQSVTPGENVSGNPDLAESSEAASAADVVKRELPEAAKRALAEAAERRAQQAAIQAASPKELGGVNGPDPARYGDWEKDGIVSDF